MKRPGSLLIWWLSICLMLGQLRAVAGPHTAAADTAALRRQLHQPLPDTARVRILNHLCFLLHDERPVTALGYGENAVGLARRLPKAVQAPLLLNSLLHLASCYANLSNGPQALRLISEAHTLARQLNDLDGLTRAYAATGGIYHERNDSATAWQHYRRALQLAGQPEVRPRTRMKLLGNAANLVFFRGQHARALHLDSLALALARQQGDAVAEAHYLTSLGSYHLRLNHLPQAERILKQAVAISQREHSLRIQASQLELLAMYYTATGQPRRTDSVTREALRVARQSGFLERVLDAYSILGTEAAARRDYRQAHEWDQQYILLNDSLNSRQTMQTLAATQASYENQERVRRIRALTQEHELEVLRTRLLAGVVVVLLAGLLAVGYLYRKLQRSRTALAHSHAALQEASKQLRSVAVFKDKLYAIVAHDLRGPVTAFAGVTGLIDSYIKQNNLAELARLPAIVRQAADSLNRLLDNVLNWAVSQTGELACRPEALSVAALFAECQALYQTTAEASQQQITVTVPANLRLLADHNMVRTILRNLMGNALKFTPPGGHVHLDAVPDPADPHMVLISCTDTGPGISAAAVASLMSGPDVPAPVTTPQATGLGLGLALCRAFVHRHGGTLVIQSRPGAGTNVTVSLPAAA